MKIPLQATARGRNLPGNRGFTLVEVMIASLLVSVVMGSVYTLFHSTLISWRTVERGYDLQKEGRDFASLVQRELNNVIQDAEHLFTGDGNEFTAFVVSEPLNVEDASGRHVLRVRYYFNRAKKEVFREEALVQSPLPKPPSGENSPVDRSKIKLSRGKEFVVAEHVKSFKLSYVWIPRPDEPRDPLVPPPHIDPMELEQHHELWRVGYPAAVRLQLVLEHPGRAGTVYEVDSLAPIRLQGNRWTRRQLNQKLGISR